MKLDAKKAELDDALDEAQTPLVYSDAKDAVGGGMTADHLLENYATTEERDGELVVVGLDGNVREFDDAQPADDDESDETPADDVAGEDDDADDEDDEIDADDVRADPDEEPDGDYHLLNGIRITSDPDELLVGEQTGDTYRHVPVLENGRDDVPDPEVAYMPTKIGGSRDSEEVVGRMMGQKDRPVLLEGEAGTGKNTLVDSLCAPTNRTTYRMDFGEDTSVYDLIGEKDIVDGTSVYILGELSKAAVFGGTFIGDEINMMDGGVSAHLHAITEEKGKRRLVLRGTGVTLRDLPDDKEWDAEKHLGKYIHPEFRFVGTCNPLTYAGTEDMNTAFRSRFAVIPLDYLPADKEAKLLSASTGVDESDAKDLCKLAEVLREAHEHNELNCAITHRELKKTVELAGADEQFMDLDQAAEIILKGHASLPQDKDTIGDQITQELR